jgi:hypothetical protein
MERQVRGRFFFGVGGLLLRTLAVQLIAFRLQIYKQIAIPFSRLLPHLKESDSFEPLQNVEQERTRLNGRQAEERSALPFTRLASSLTRHSPQRPPPQALLPHDLLLAPLQPAFRHVHLVKPHRRGPHQCLHQLAVHIRATEARATLLPRGLGVEILRRQRRRRRPEGQVGGESPGGTEEREA